MELLGEFLHEEEVAAQGRIHLDRISVAEL